MDNCAVLDLEITGATAQAPGLVRVAFFDPDTPAMRPPTLEQFAIDRTALAKLEPDPRAYGAALWQAVFGAPAIAEELRYARQTVQVQAVARSHPKLLRLRLSIDAASALHALRWETLRAPNGQWLLADETLIFSRLLGTTRERTAALPSKDGLRVVVAVAAPPQSLKDYQLVMDAPPELGRALAAIDRVPVDPSRVSQLVSGTGAGVTTTAILEALGQGCDLLYLVCHGMQGNQGEGFLFLDPAPGADPGRAVPARDLVEGVRALAAPPALVVLVSCDSGGDGSSSGASTLQALGPRLVDAGVLAVVAMNGHVGATTIAELMPRFFEALGRHGEVDRALAASRFAVAQRSDAWMPVVYMQRRDGRVWRAGGPTNFEGLNALNREDRTNPTGKKQKDWTAFLGPGLLEPIFGSQEDLARRWADDERVPLPRDRDVLSRVAHVLATMNQATRPDYVQDALPGRMRAALGSRWRNQNDAQASIATFLKAIGNETRKNPQDPHVLLARLDIPIYVTATPDNLMAQALTAVGKSPQVAVCPWRRTEAEEEEAIEATVERPLVYHLFGRFEEPESLVLTEDDYIDLLMFSGRTPSPTARLQDLVTAAWARNTLLFLGFEQLSWDFRVMFRMVLNAERRARRTSSQARAVTAQSSPATDAWQSTELTDYMQKYFGSARVNVVWATAGDLLIELSRRLAEGGR